MPGPYIQDGHYVYGNMLNQPYPPYYNSSWYHRQPPRRSLSSLLEFYDDGTAYLPDNIPGNVEFAPIRSPLASNIVNIETLAFRSLRIKLYAVKEEDDIDLVLELGKTYSVTYLTEGGLKVATGVLKLIDSTIPDTCTRYIGEFNETVATAWIGLDCSTTGKSDKRKIFIASIRTIEEVPEDDPNYVPPTVDSDGLTDSQKLNTILELFTRCGNKLDLILSKVENPDNASIAKKLEDMDPTEKLEYLITLIDSGAITAHNTENEP